MNCERIQELLLTDYTDKELGDTARDEVEAHLASCRACREFHNAVVGAAGPIRSAGRQTPPEYVWQRIKQRIDAEAARSRAFSMRLAEFVKTLSTLPSRIPKGALAFAAAAMLIVAVITARPGADRSGVDVYLNQQMDFISTLGTVDSNGTSIFDTEVKTSVENLL